MTHEPKAFSADSFAFLTDLAKNNSKDWFTANKATYEKVLKRPSAALREDLGQRLGDLTGQKLASKLFRINRDLRFSKDKTPYNTHVRMAFWPEDNSFEGRQAQPPSFFLSIEASELRLGTGCMQFSKPVLERYLTGLETGLGEKLTSLAEELIEDGFEISTPDLAKPPRGFPKDSRYANLARHKGLAVWATIPDTSLVLGQDAAERLADLFRPALSFWNTLIDLHRST
jgi:uncharacterized protein (TIGR02453 family)